MEAFRLMNTVTKNSKGFDFNFVFEIESGDVDNYEYEMFSRHELQNLIGSKLIELLVRFKILLNCY